MTKPEFANICNGTMLKNYETGLVYQLRERICRKLVLIRVTPQASAPLCEIVLPSQGKQWGIEDRR